MDGNAGGYALEAMFDSWASEKRMLRRGVFPQVSTSADWRDIGHYTQLIWAGTERVGCAVHRTEQWDYLICRYAPVGNVVGERVP